MNKRMIEICERFHENGDSVRASFLKAKKKALMEKMSRGNISMEIEKALLKRKIELSMQKGL